MLIKFIDHKDKTHWVNPAYVKSVKEKGADKAQIEVSGWAMSLVVKGQADDVAGLINLAIQEAALMGLGPLGGGGPGSPTPAQLAEEQQQTDSTQAAIISSVVIGG
jgi:hypothetical protein